VGKEETAASLTPRRHDLHGRVGLRGDGERASIAITDILGEQLLLENAEMGLQQKNPNSWTFFESRSFF
jgi:hypothetical protein